MGKRGRGRENREQRHQSPGPRRKKTVWACVEPEVAEIILDIARARKRSRSWVLRELIDELLGVEKSPGKDKTTR